MGARLDTSATRDVPSPEGTRRIRASSKGVLDKSGAQAPPSAEVLIVSLGTGTEGGSAS